MFLLFCGILFLVFARSFFERFWFLYMKDTRAMAAPATLRRSLFYRRHNTTMQALEVTGH